MSDTALFERARLPATRRRGVPAEGFPSVSPNLPSATPSAVPHLMPGKARPASRGPERDPTELRDRAELDLDWRRFEVPSEREDERGYLATPEPDREAQVIFLLLGATALALLLQATATAVFFVERWQSFERLLDGLF